MPALARLSQLANLTLDVQGQLNTLAMSLLLSNLRMLTKLRNLSLRLNQSWVDATPAWQELGRITQLESLTISCGTATQPMCRAQDLVTLGGLRKLKQLHVDSYNLAELPPQQQPQHIRQAIDSLTAEMQHYRAQQQQQMYPYVPPGYMVYRPPVPQMQQDLQRMRNDLDHALQLQREYEVLAASESVAFLQHLTALTSLKVPLATTAGLCGLFVCTRLQGLTLLRASNRDPVLASCEWASLACLTGLTCLQCLGGMHESIRLSPFHNCLKSLPQLRELAATSWTPQALHALSHLRWLQRLQGSWSSDAHGVAANITCPSVTQLSYTAGMVPFKAFPNLVELHQDGSFTAAAVEDLSRHCSSLSAVWGSKGTTAYPTICNSATTAAVAAIQGMSRLQHLTYLEFHAADDLQLAALSCAQSPAQSLQYVCVKAANRPAQHPVSLNGLMQLAHFKGVQHIKIHTAGLQLSLQTVQMLLCSLRMLPEVTVVCAHNTHAALFVAADAVLESAGLDCTMLALSY